MKLKDEQKTQTYIVPDQNDNTMNQESATIAVSSISHHPTRFTVHLPADYSKLFLNCSRIVFQ